MLQNLQKLVCFLGTTKRTGSRAKRIDTRAGVIIFAWKKTNFDLEVVCIETTSEERGGETKNMVRG